MPRLTMTSFVAGGLQRMILTSPSSFMTAVGRRLTLIRGSLLVGMSLLQVGLPHEQGGRKISLTQRLIQNHSSQTKTLSQTY
uniref:Uncharacterized protein n=1 Tax=uncultured marine virus TaxID=186617 RepID=A0A0F7L7W4_9VIRU|nr:hypothetical protein [uncultured marine virus]